MLASVAAGLVRAVRGPSTADRLIAVQLVGTGGVAVLLLLWGALGDRAFQDAALVLVLLAAVAAAVVTRGADAAAAEPPAAGGPRG